MNTAELLAHIDRHIQKVRQGHDQDLDITHAAVVEFLRDYAGEQSEFVRLVKILPTSNYTPEFWVRCMGGALEQYRDYVASGLHEAVTPVRQAKIDTVSDFLGQADALLSDGRTHPAGAAVLVGASLDAFLREWVEAEGISASKSGIDGYAEALCKAGKIEKEDVKDITAWAGRRNNAAHGEWDKVADAQHIRLMLDGVNLFMRKYGAK